jgi:hypothetical protein
MGAGQRFLVPHWGLVAPFALATGWELRPRGPRRHPGPGFLAQAAELLADSAGLTDKHKAIAEYWADGPDTETPPGHWCLLAQEMSARDGHGLDDVRLFFALTGALLDAGIACWGRQADLRLGPAGHGPPVPVRRPGGPGLGRPGAGDAPHPG